MNLAAQNDTVKTKASLKAKLTPKLYVIIVLLIMGAVAVTKPADQIGIVNIMAAVLTAVFLDGLAGLPRRKWFFSDGGVITGLIIGLILSSSVPVYLTVITTAIAIFSKHFLRIRNKPVFNPAVVGLSVSVFLFSTEQSWWGAFTGLPAWTVLLMLVGGSLITGRVNKFPQIFAFLGVYFTLFLILGLGGYGLAGDAFRVPFLNSVLFFAFFMLTDPPTSPGKYNDQVLFGLIAGIVAAVVYVLVGGLMFLFIGLLAANAWHVLRKRTSFAEKIS